MSKQFLKNLLKPGVNHSEIDGTPEERKTVTELFVEHGMSKGMVYTRMLRKGPGSGFEPWELTGIRSLVREYAAQCGMPVPKDEQMHQFYDGLDSKSDFCDFMSARGMGKNCTIYHFKAWDFKSWELIGADTLINQLLVEE